MSKTFLGSLAVLLLISQYSFADVIGSSANMSPPHLNRCTEREGLLAAGFYGNAYNYTCSGITPEVLNQVIMPSELQVEAEAGVNLCGEGYTFVEGSAHLTAACQTDPSWSNEEGGIYIQIAFECQRCLDELKL
jgi:hypothetical protein